MTDPFISKTTGVTLGLVIALVSVSAIASAAWTKNSMQQKLILEKLDELESKIQIGTADRFTKTQMNVWAYSLAASNPTLVVPEPNDPQLKRIHTGP